MSTNSRFIPCHHIFVFLILLVVYIVLKKDNAIINKYIFYVVGIVVACSSYIRTNINTTVPRYRYGTRYNIIPRTFTERYVSSNIY